MATLPKILSAAAAVALVISPMASTAAFAQDNDDEGTGARPGMYLVPVAGGLIIAGVIIASKGNSN